MSGDSVPTPLPPGYGSGATHHNRHIDGHVAFVPVVMGWERPSEECAGELAPRWRALLEVEGIAGGPGRAEDVALKLSYHRSDEWSVSAGYRIVEGGAATDDVYSFAWFNSAVASVACRF